MRLILLILGANKPRVYALLLQVVRKKVILINGNDACLTFSYAVRGVSAVDSKRKFVV